jgi:hypothetical protein
MRIDELTRKIYLDLDGVLCDCARAAAEFNNISVKQFTDAKWDNDFWINVVKNANLKDFFENLHWESNGKKLVQFLFENNLQFEILSSPCSFPNTSSCIKGKKIWLQKHGLSNIHAIFSCHKEKYAGNGNILIDDLPFNISKWNSAGGIGILHSNDNYQRTFKMLGEIFPNR